MHLWPASHVNLHVQYSSSYSSTGGSASGNLSIFTIELVCYFYRDPTVHVSTFVLVGVTVVAKRFALYGGATFFRSLDRAIYLIILKLSIVRILTAFCKRCLCLATLK